MLENYISLFPSSSRAKPRFMALAQSLLHQVTDLIALAQSLVPGFSVENAVGVQLDAIGKSFSIPRQENWTDETYRTIILRKLKRNTWDGTNESVPDYLLPGESICDNCNGTVTINTNALPLPPNELLPIPMGIKAI